MRQSPADDQRRDALQVKAEFFKALAHPMRIRILELLSTGAKSVNELQKLLGSEGSAVSQQLAVLRSKNVVTSVKEGTTVIYSLRDPRIKDVLDTSREIIDRRLSDTISLLKTIRDEQ